MTICMVFGRTNRRLISRGTYLKCNDVMSILIFPASCRKNSFCHYVNYPLQRNVFTMQLMLQGTTHTLQQRIHDTTNAARHHTHTTATYSRYN